MTTEKKKLTVYLKPKNGKPEYAHTGEKIGMLTLLGVVDRRKYSRYVSHNIFRCRCDCGRVVDLFWESIRNMRWPSCGCQTTPHITHDENGKLTSCEPGARLPYGPKMRWWVRHEKPSFGKSEEMQLKAQIHRSITYVLQGKKRFKTNSGSRLEKAQTAVRKYSKARLQKLVDKVGMKKAVDKIYAHI